MNDTFTSYWCLKVTHNFLVLGGCWVVSNKTLSSLRIRVRHHNSLSSATGLSSGSFYRSSWLRFSHWLTGHSTFAWLRRLLLVAFVDRESLSFDFGSFKETLILKFLKHLNVVERANNPVSKSSDAVANLLKYFVSESWVINVVL